MTDTRYPIEELGDDEDDGTMPSNVEQLAKEVVGHRIVAVSEATVPPGRSWGYEQTGLVLTLDNGRSVALVDTSDCCAFTALEEFFLNPEAVDHMVMGVGTTDGYETWHIYADFGDIMKLKVGWSAGNPFYYGYGFDIRVIDADGKVVDAG